MSKPKVVSLFSGCGGMDLGFKHAGYELIWANDFEKAACDTYAINLGEHIVHGDITELDLKQIPDCDVMIGGFPCQDFSMIWKRGGLETDRGNLYKYFVKAVKLKKPRIFVAENVKGLLTANKGAAVKTITEDFARIGYKVSVDLYNFADYGVPQIRQRIFIVGVRNDVDWEFLKPEPTHVKEKYVSAGKALVGVKKVKLNNEHQNIAEKTKKMLNMIPEGGNFSDIPKNHPLYVKGMISHVYRRLHRGKPSTTIIAGGGGGTWGYHFEEPRPLTNRERARLFCYPDDFAFVGSITEVRKQIGNSVPPLAARILAEALLPAFKASSVIRRKVGISPDKNVKNFSSRTSLKSKAM
ncbi:Dcm Site-specific DNA methylase [Candidatus Planktophila vernalis]|uniref:DNA cytosine methyltransferase n=1 Tax=Candidatus Planktophila vernalis TaxID=1884907 RepID=UPI003CFB1D02